MSTRNNPATQFASIFVLMALLGSVGFADDWPTWRGNASRTASTTEQLPAALHLQWSRSLSPLTPAWPEDARLQFDGDYEPVVLGGTMFVASSQNDSVIALDTKTGETRWRIFAEGPVRLAPLAHENHIYFGADDGFLYCLEAGSGKLAWKFQAAPVERRVIGNERLISAWPVRGGPVLQNDTLYFTAGVWPFEGTQLFALRLDGAKAPTVQEGRVATTILQDFAPQGYLAASRERLFIPGGRADAYCLDLATGKRVGLNYNARGTTDYHVTALDKWMFHGGKIADVEGGKSLSLTAERPVGDQGKIYFAGKGLAQAYDLENQQTVTSKDRRGQPVEIQVPRLLWRLDGQPVTRVHAKAGQRIYAHHEHTVLAIDVPEKDGDKPTVSWTAKVDGTPATMLVADGKLFVVTHEGSIHRFAGEKVEPQVEAKQANELRGSAQWRERVGTLIKQTGVTDGYCLALGVGSGDLVEELVRQSQLHIVVIDPDAARVDALRRRYDDEGIYGTRVSALVGDPATLALPPYLASLIVAEEASQLKPNAPSIRHVFEVLRPYGGTICLETDEGQHRILNTAVAEADLPQAKVMRQGSHTLLIREGALPGTADWTHEYGDPANTLMSRDTLVKAPLGVLWFGGPSADGNLFYDRHDWGPSLAVIEGRMFLQGPQKLTAVDVYTGRILWQLPLVAGISPGRRANWSPAGYHFVAVQDAIYLAYPEKCLRIDPKTGKKVGEFTLPEEEDEWGRMLVQDDLMIVPVFRRQEGGEPLVSKLVALDRQTGKVRWSKPATQSFSLVALGDDTAYCVDAPLEGLYKGDDKKRRKDGVPQSEIVPTVKALDLASGEEKWDRTTPRIPEWLSYSQEHDVLVASNKNGVETWRGKNGQELWNKDKVGNGFRGHPENYYGRVILWKDQIIDQRGPGAAYALKTGKAIQRTDPITGQDVDWEFTKIGHHCNYAIANEHLLTFRAADAGFCDLDSGGMTGRLTGFRSGCRNSLIPADGVLNAPNMAHGCVCGFSIFTSLALVHVPEADLWTYGAYARPSGEVERIGINLGAAGDRRDEHGTLWLDHPNVGGPSPNVTPKLTAENPQWFRLHSSKVTGEVLPWVAASGVKGVTGITVPLVFDDKAESKESPTYTVRLYFMEPSNPSPDTDVFDVAIEGKPVLTDFDVVREAGGPMVGVVKEFDGVAADGELVITLTTKKGTAMLSGVEVSAEVGQAP